MPEKYLYRGRDFVKEVIAAEIPIKTIFDVGSHKGESLSWFASNWPSSEIHCFEPVSEHHPQVQAIADQHPNAMVTINPFALSDPSNRTNFGKIVLHGPGAHILRPGETVSKEQIGDCLVTTIDDYVGDHGISCIDILKIDVEGHELSVLKGAANCICSGLVKFIYLELGMYSGNKHHTPWRIASDFLLALDYEVFGVYEQINEFLANELQLRRSNFGFIHRSIVTIAATHPPGA